eukprot:12176.XXX_661919_662146_1 [CDS] Oithona nana genome sequencing.
MLACHELANALAAPQVDYGCPRGYVFCKLIFGCCRPGHCRPYNEATKCLLLGIE